MLCFLERISCYYAFSYLHCMGIMADIGGSKTDSKQIDVLYRNKKTYQQFLTEKKKSILSVAMNKTDFLWCGSYMIDRDYHMAIFISYPISTRDTHISPRAEGPRADMGNSDWYGVWYENCHIIIYLSYFFFFWQVWLFDLFVLRFYGPVNPMGSCRARSVYLTTHLLGRLSPLSG